MWIGVPRIGSRLGQQFRRGAIALGIVLIIWLFTSLTAAFKRTLLEFCDEVKGPGQHVNAWPEVE